MIKDLYKNPKESEFRKLSERPQSRKDEMQAILTTIFDSIQQNGDLALKEFTKKYDSCLINEIEISKEEIERSISLVSKQLKDAIDIAKSNIEKFHAAQVKDDISIQIMEGVECMQKSIGIERVGLYIPGGSAPLFSSVLMLAIPANIAACNDVILCTPPDKNGEVHPAILYAADLCRVSKIYKAGGAQAIAAMSLGTETIPKVSKLFGPGNQYVTAAKLKALEYGVAMDMPAGPSELLVYAAYDAIPEFVAADVLSQAEHGPDSQVILVSESEEMIHSVNQEISFQLDGIPRKEIALQALDNSKCLLFDSTDLAFTFINQYGPEHLIIATDKPEDYMSKIINAGSVFLGNYCPESAGDYASGTNHTLPTNGWTKSYSGINVDSFTRKITFQKINKKGIKTLGPTIIEMANNEDLQAHANAVSVRLEAIKSDRND